MPSTQEFRRRIKSVQNTKQITRAMEMVASVKMQKAQRSIIEARSYIQNSWHMLSVLANHTAAEKHPLLEKREVKNIALVVATSDKGLCGSFNSDVLRKTLHFIKENGDKKIDIISIGRKGADYLRRNSRCDIVAQFQDYGREIEFEEILPIAKVLRSGYLDKTYDQIDLIYSHFESALKQTPVVKQLLPIVEDHMDILDLWQKPIHLDKEVEYKFEPDPDTVLERLLPQFLRMQLFGAMLESNASEHSARMVGMKNATDNAGSLIDELTLLYNSIRQDSITREIAEISSAAEAMG